MSQRLRRTRTRRPTAATPGDPDPKNGSGTANGERPQAPGRAPRFERNIDKIVRKFDVSILENLSPKLTDKGLPEAFVLNEIEKFLDSQAYRVFQWEDLGVYGGAFGVAHYSREDFILLQSPKYSPSDIELGRVEIPCLPDRGAEQNYKDLIDYLFIGRRSRQPLAGANQDSYAPEFFWHLARIYHPTSTNLQGPYHHQRYRMSYFDKYLLHNKKAPYLYCPIGEVAFFIYAWRLLFRCIQKSGSVKAELNGGLSLGRHGEFDCREVWNKEFWEGQGLSEDETVQMNALPEWGWIVALRNLEALTMSGAADQATSEFGESVRLQWETWRERLDTNPTLSRRKSHPWITDWVSLGLIKRVSLRSYWGAEARDALLALLMFASHVETRESVRRELCEKARLVRNSIQNGSALDWRTLCDLMRGADSIDL